ncbi:2328_t:CDS:2 [Entrophospora sp. SA101]|nr:2328_t:CDS:2 [Entrophospora sp. SA101]
MSIIVYKDIIFLTKPFGVKSLLNCLPTDLSSRLKEVFSDLVSGEKYHYSIIDQCGELLTSFPTKKYKNLYEFSETNDLIDWLKRIITEKRESYEFNDIIKELIDLIPKSSSPKKFSFGNYRSPSKFPLRDIDPKSVGRWKIDRVTLLEGWEKCIKDYEYEIINRCSTDVLVSRKMYQGAHVARRSQYDILFRNWSLKIVGVCSNTYNVIFG